NISMLAGKKPSTLQAQCASDYTTAVINTTGQDTQWSGVMYAPYGQVYFGGNWNGGSGHANGPIIAYSFDLGGGAHPDQNQQFNLDPGLLTQLSPVTALIK